MTFADPFAQSVSSQANVARALSELRRGGAIAISAGAETAIAIAAELVEEAGFAWALSAAEAGAGTGAGLLMTVEATGRLRLGGPLSGGGGGLGGPPLPPPPCARARG